MSGRIEWVDVFKGIAILLVVLGHAASPYNVYIYLFHVPAFFFIAGYTTLLNKYKLGEMASRRFKTLIIPFIFVNLIFIFIVALLSLFGISNIFFMESINISQIGHYVYSLFSNLSTIEVGGGNMVSDCIIRSYLNNKICK